MSILPIEEFGVVCKIDVSNLDTSTGWYTEKLGLVVDPRFKTSTWEQLNVPGVQGAAVGLNLDRGGVGSGGAVLTFVVPDIKQVREQLDKDGVAVGPIEDAGDGVYLAFFNDPDGNQLGLRQNPDDQPRANAIGQAR
jgi:catechol 2,3-dioxygenase-like lactoylglutathione lyase family enzyme